jgi:hypothetical protein
MLPLASEPNDQYDCCCLDAYQFVSQGILCSLALLYIYRYIHCLMDIVAGFLLSSLLHLFYLDPRTACMQKTVYSFVKEFCLIVSRNHLNFY